MLILLTLAVKGKGDTPSQWMTGHTTVTAIDHERGNRKIPVEIWYPAREEGKDKPLTEAEASFPVIVFGHGYVLSPGSYKNIIDLVVAEGYIIAFPLKEQRLFPGHNDLAQDLAFTVRQFEAWGKDSSSLFYGRLSGQNCVMGHSMGGGAAVLAAAMEPRIGKLALLAPFDTRPSAISAAPQVSCASLIIAGSSDCVTPPKKNQIPLYEALASDDKMYISITGGTHCGMTSSKILCPAAECTCFPRKTIHKKEQHALIALYLMPWLDAMLRGHSEEKNKLENSLPADHRVTFRSSTF